METPAASPKPRRALARRIAVAAGAAFVLDGAIGAFVVPSVAKRMIASRLSEQLGRAVEIDHLSFNPYTFEATAGGFRMLEADRQRVFVSFERLEANGSYHSITSLAPVIDEVTLHGLKVRLVRDGENHYNVSDVLQRLAAAPKAKPGEEARFSLANIRVVGGALDFDDRPKGALHRVTDIDIAIPLLSNLPTHLKEYVQPRLHAVVNGAPLRIGGETLPFENTLRTHVVLQLEGFDLPRYVGYSPAPLPVKIDAGKLDGRIEVQFTQAQAKEAAIVITGNLAVHGLAVSSSARELGRISVLRVEGIRVDPLARQARIESVATSGSAIALLRRADGSLELPVIAAASEAQARAEKPWSAALARATIDDCGVTLVDESVKPALTHRVSLVHVEARDLSTDTSVKPEVVARLAFDKGGTAEVEAAIALEPLAVEAKIDARRIDLVSLRPYLAHFQTVKVKSALASAKGRLELHREGQRTKVGYTGSAEVARLATLDTASQEELIDWDSVRADRIALAWATAAPLDLVVGAIDVVKAYARVVVTPEGRINLQQLKFATNADPAPAPESQEAPEARNVRIDRIRFVESRLNFTDHFIKPNYTADVGELGGTVTGLSSDPSARAAVDLKGSYDKSSPVVISGAINPLAGNLFLDIAAQGKDIELPRLSAYSARYAGYGITGGHLTLDVKYHVEDGKLEGRNNIFIDQLTFGEKVESPEATKLPVLFAVNLLKDSQGHISLELPISGSLEDPQFAVSALIAQVVGNLLKKAVTSPFSLLMAASGPAAGAANGGNADDLASVSFDPGRDEAGEAERAKLDRLSKALLDRPAVRIEMTSHFDAGKDLAALRRAALHASLEKAHGGALDEAGYAAELKKAYLAEFPPQPAADAKNPPKMPGVEEMEAKLLERVTVDDAQLRALAERRAQWVKNYFVTQGALPAERVLVASSEASAAAERGNRVDFTLK